MKKKALAASQAIPAPPQPAALTHEEWVALAGMLRSSAVPGAMLDQALVLRNKLEAWIRATAPAEAAPT